MKNKEKMLDLLGQILTVAQLEDKQHKIAILKAGKGSKAIGDGWMVFHLKRLKSLIDES